ncbi:hypothetical protein ACWDWU_01050 [Streptomyces sp. NPDC003442]
MTRLNANDAFAEVEDDRAGQHALTFGWLTGEILRRATDLRPHELLAEYLSTPLAADAWIGLPARVESRVATVHPAPEVADPEALAGEGWPGVLTPPGIRFSTGFLVNGFPGRPLLSDLSFGHDGANGSLGFADAGAAIGFGYLNNQLANPVDERANRLTAALQHSLRA